MNNEDEAIHRYQGKLVEFFPPEEADSPWLLRLMIIRDDLDFELRNLGLNTTAGDLFRLHGRFLQSSIVMASAVVGRTDSEEAIEQGRVRSRRAL